MDKFSIHGVDQTTGQTVELVLSAADEREAATRAVAMGIAVDQVTRQSGAIEAPEEAATVIPQNRPIINRPAAPPVARAAPPPPAGPVDHEAETFVPGRELAELVAPFPRVAKSFVIPLAIEAVIGLVVTLFLAAANPTETGAIIVGVFISACVVVVVQLLFLLPVLKPGVKPGKPSPWAVWVGAGIAGLMTGLLCTMLVFLLADFTYGIGMTREQPQDGAIIHVATPLVLLGSWIVSSILLASFMRSGPTVPRLSRIASMLFLGTVVESLAAIPVLALVDKRSSCWSTTFSATGLFITMTVGTILMGPVILLAVVRRRSRAGDGGLCAACGYDMRGHGQSGRCPECGAGWKRPAVAAG